MVDGQSAGALSNIEDIECCGPLVKQAADTAAQTSMLAKTTTQHCNHSRVYYDSSQTPMVSKRNLLCWMMGKWVMEGKRWYYTEMRKRRSEQEQEWKRVLWQERSM